MVTRAVVDGQNSKISRMIVLDSNEMFYGRAKWTKWNGKWQSEITIIWVFLLSECAVHSLLIIVQVSARKITRRIGNDKS